MPKTPQPTKKPKLTVKERKFVAAKVAGKTNYAAYKEAGYKISTRANADVIASQTLKKPKIQEAINIALESLGATPEFAVGRIKEVADLTEVNPASSLAASKLILQLHGWNQADRPSVQLNIKNSFFANGKTSNTRKPIEGQVVE